MVNEKGRPRTLKMMLGARMQEIRLEKGLTQQQAADRAGCSIGTLSTIETGRNAMTVKMIAALLYLYEVDHDTSRILIARAKASRERGWYQPLLPNDLVDYDLFVECEGWSDVTVMSYEASSVTGLLQTEAYATLLTEQTVVNATRRRVSDVVALRMERQSTFFSSGSRRRLVWITTPQALKMQVGSPDVMDDQVRHLDRMVSEGSVEIHVIPPESGPHPSVGCEYVLFASRELGAIVYNDIRHSMRMCDDDQQTSSFMSMFYESRKKAIRYEDYRRSAS